MNGPRMNPNDSQMSEFEISRNLTNWRKSNVSSQRVSTWKIDLLIFLESPGV
jgi:hypothetical protein